MSAEPCLLALTPPRSSPVTLAGQAQMLAALAHTRRPARRGIALEIAGKGGHVRFLARAANPAARAALEGALAGYFPQGTVHLLSDPADDLACIRPGEVAVAAELRLRFRPELPLRTVERAGERPDVADPSAGLQRVLGALRRLDGDTRGLCQVLLWPGPRGWGEHLARAREQALARERALGTPGEDVPALPAALAALAVLGALGGLAAYHEYARHGVTALLPFAAAGGIALGGLLLLWRLATRRHPPLHIAGAQGRRARLHRAAPPARGRSGPGSL